MEAVLGRVAVQRVRAEDLPEGPVLLGGAVVEDASLNARPPSMPELMGALVMPSAPPFRCTVVLDDSELQRTLIRDGLLEQGLSEQVLCAALGPEFLTTVTQAFIANAQIDLAILDLELPGLGGFAAAIAMRAIERAFNVDPAPIVFFSGRTLDEAARRSLATVESSMFLSKDTGRGAGHLFAKLAENLRTLRRHGNPA
jgi:CheY-like chemotaxis protein